MGTKLFQLRNVKTQANIKALIYQRLRDSVAERIKHKASNIPTYSQKELKSTKRRDSSLGSTPAITLR